VSSVFRPFFPIIARNQQTLKRLFYINNAKEVIQPVLSVNVGERYASFAITDNTGTELSFLVYYTADEINGESLPDIFSGHPELNRSFYEVKISYGYSGNVLVPSEMYNTDATKTMLKVMHGTDGHNPVISEAVNEWQLYNVFAIPADVQQWISRKFPAGNYRHHFTLGLKTMPAGPADRLLINVHTDEFSFIAIKDNKLLIAQSHLYSSPEDICYFLLKTCHQYSLSQEQVQLSVSGLIDKESQLYREMYQFFVHVEFRSPAWNIPTTGENEYQPHFFTTLNDLARCAS
jgi:hypothetical protein